MRISVPKGYRPAIEKLMSQLQTDDPALAVNHVIGCWLASNGCPGQAIAASTSPEHHHSSSDEFADIIEF